MGFAGLGAEGGVEGVKERVQLGGLREDVRRDAHAFRAAADADPARSAQVGRSLNYRDAAKFSETTVQEIKLNTKPDPTLLSKPTK